MGEGLEISVAELANLKGRGPEPLLLDVREPFEWEIARIDGATHVPLGELAARLGELDGHREIVTYCHRGVRSLRAAEILRAAGFTRVRSLRGGIDAWAREAEPGMATY